MNQIGKALQQISSRTISPGSSSIQAYSKQTGELSIYSDTKLDVTTSGKIMAVLSTATKLNDAAQRLIIDRMISNGFTCRRAVDAVAHVIDTYDRWDKEPSVADFISYDRKIKTLSHAELAKVTSEGGAAWDDFAPVDIGIGKPRWAKIEDIERHNLKKWPTERESPADCCGTCREWTTEGMRANFEGIGICAMGGRHLSRHKADWCMYYALKENSHQ